MGQCLYWKNTLAHSHINAESVMQTHFLNLISENKNIFCFNSKRLLLLKSFTFFFLKFDCTTLAKTGRFKVRHPIDMVHDAV